MNPRQKSVLVVGIFLVGLAALYPPWIFVDQYLTRGGEQDIERPAGYYFFFAPPTPDRPPDARPSLIATLRRIDTRQLTVEWAAIVLVVAGLLLLLRSRPVSPETSKPSDAGSVDPGPTESHKPSSLDGHPPASVSRNLPNKSPSGKSQEVASVKPLVAPHWAIAELLDRQVDLDALAEEAMKKVPTDRFQTERDPILFLLDRQNPQLPPWLPEEWERPLSPQERAYWFDLLLRFYSHSFTYWPPRGDKNSRLQEVVTALYHMYRDSLLGALPPPSFIDGK